MFGVSEWSLGGGNGFPHALSVGTEHWGSYCGEVSGKAQ